MKAFYTVLIFCLIGALCVGVIYLALRPEDAANYHTNPEVVADEREEITLTVPQALTLVEGEEKLFYAFCNYENAVITTTLPKNDVVAVSNFTLTALSSGSVVCYVKAEYDGLSIEKQIYITVSKAFIAFNMLEFDEGVFYSGLNAGGNYKNYKLQVSTNFSLLNKNFVATENVHIVSAVVSGQDNTQAVIEFNLLESGVFKIQVGSLTYSNTSQAFNNNLDVNFEKAFMFENDILTLNLLSNAKQEAYENMIFDTARILNFNSDWQVVLSNDNVTHENGVFSAVKLGSTSVTIKSKAVLFYDKTFEIVVQEIKPQSFDFKLNGKMLSKVELFENESVEIEVFNILPAFALNKEFKIVHDTNFLFDETTSTLTALNCGEFEIIVKLVGNQNVFKTFIVKVNKVLPPEEEEKVYKLVLIKGAEEFSSDNKNAINLSAGLHIFQLRLQDETNALINEFITIKNWDESNENFYLEGKVLVVNLQTSQTITFVVLALEVEFEFNFVIA